MAVEDETQEPGLVVETILQSFMTTGHVPDLITAYQRTERFPTILPWSRMPLDGQKCRPASHHPGITRGRTLAAI